MRVIRDGFAHIDINGERVHTKVRVLQDDSNRLAVFTSPTSGPAHVYNMGDITITRTGATCSHPVCFGKASRQKLTRLWEHSERVGA